MAMLRPQTRMKPRTATQLVMGREMSVCECVWVCVGKSVTQTRELGRLYSDFSPLSGLSFFMCKGKSDTR
jgi:hypothetical protein